MTLEHAAGRLSLGRKLFSTPDRALAVLRAAWPAAVGPELARRTELVAMQGRTLWVRVPDAGWRKALHRMRGDLRHRLRRGLGDLAPGRLAFVIGELEADAVPPPEPTPDPPDPGPAPAPVEAAAQAIPDPELRRLFLESSARYLRHTRNGSPSDA